MRWIKVKKPLPEGMWKKFLILCSVLGPGFVTANVNNDAGGIAAFSTAGAYPFGYSCLWALIPITVVLILTQEMGIRMGAVTGKGLADLLREQYGLRVTFYLMLALFVTNVANTVAEFAGVAASLAIFGVHKWISVPLAAAAVWLLVVRGTYKSVEKVFLFATLFYLAYIVSGYLAHPNWGEVATALVLPSIDWSRDYLYMIVALMGAAIAPWMQFYVQAAIVEKGVAADNYAMARLDVIVGCMMASLVAAFIIIACAATLGKVGIPITSGADAAVALRPLAGNHASLFFALGLFMASLFAASILPLSTAYTICEGLGFEAGVNKTFEEAPQFYGIYTALIVIGAVIVLWPSFPLFQMMVFSQVVNGLILPILLFYLIRLASNRELLGEFANSRRFSNCCYVALGVIVAVDSALLGLLFL